jgi:hypothetical protein
VQDLPQSLSELAIDKSPGASALHLTPQAEPAATFIPKVNDGFEMRRIKTASTLNTHKKTTVYYF